ncbi:MAG: hypothetical protein NTW29_19425 [Bacteroidetes bacterium]|nr:hypothetical protein [Bacteroidota bacterium]
MKIVQSCWTKPFLKSPNSLKDSRLNGGWPARKYNYFSWALSCLQLSSFYDTIELVTDDAGKFLLIDQIRLPYTRVSLELNNLSDYNTGFWALGKIKAYSLQEQPFLHIDNDIFISSPFDERIKGAALIAQNSESSITEYAQLFNEIADQLDYLPSYLAGLKGRQHIVCSNAGIMGGNDIPFFKLYTREAFAFIDRNIRFFEENMSRLNTAYINVIAEQVIYYQLSRMENKEITYFFPDIPDVPPGIGHFHNAGKLGGFTHCLGFFKQNRLVCYELEETLKNQYPEYYYRILELLENSAI